MSHCINTHRALVPFFAIAAALLPKVAHSQTMQWQQDYTLPGYSGGPGCASQIAVAANDVPWVIGCSGPGDNGTNKSVYYLKYTPCNGECFGGTYSWTYAGGAGTQINVDAAGNVRVVTSNGHVWVAEFVAATLSTLGTATVPAGVWEDMTAANAINTNNQSLPGFGAGRLSRLATLLDSAPPIETFVSTLTIELGPPPESYWGLAYPAAANNAIFDYNASASATSWHQVTGDGARIAAFTENADTGFIQTPWVINSAGNIFSFSFTQGRFVQMPGAGALDITDHFVVSYPYIYQWSDSANGWTAVMIQNTSTTTLISRIAAAPYKLTVQGTGLYNGTVPSVTVGPSKLWGVDNEGRIFYSSSTIVPR